MDFFNTANTAQLLRLLDTKVNINTTYRDWVSPPHFWAYVQSCLFFRQLGTHNWLKFCSYSLKRQAVLTVLESCIDMVSENHVVVHGGL